MTLQGKDYRRDAITQNDETAQRKDRIPVLFINVIHIV